jgi:O-antigen/teichoic acid export membrane protein
VPVGVAICALLAFLHQDVARLLLGQEFREASKYMPWIAGGYCLCTIYHILVRICYAHDSTKYVLFSETAGAIISAGVGFAFIHTYGLHGAAIAGPISFALLVVLSIYLAYKSSLRRAASVVGTGPAT